MGAMFGRSSPSSGAGERGTYFEVAEQDLKRILAPVLGGSDFCVAGADLDRATCQSTRQARQLVAWWLLPLANVGGFQGVPADCQLMGFGVAIGLYIRS